MTIPGPEQTNVGYTELHQRVINWRCTRTELGDALAEVDAVTLTEWRRQAIAGERIESGNSADARTGHAVIADAILGVFDERAAREPRGQTGTTSETTGNPAEVCHGHPWTVPCPCRAVAPSDGQHMDRAQTIAYLTAARIRLDRAIRYVNQAQDGGLPQVDCLTVLKFAADRWHIRSLA